MKAEDINEAREDFLRYLQVVTNDGQHLEFKLTRLQRKLCDAFTEVAKSGKPVRWHVAKLPSFMRKG